MRPSPAPRTIMLLALAGAFGPATEVAAQDPPGVDVGAHVRVTTGSGATHVGLVTALGPGTIELERDVDGQLLSLPTAGMTRLEVGRQHSRAVRGLVIGLAAGVVGAVALCAAGEENCVYRHFNGGVNDFTNELPPILGAVGAVAGVLIGHREFKYERWEDVPLDRPGLSLVPGRRGGVALKVSVRF